MIQEIHDGDYENHIRGRSLAHKAINQGYYWSKMFDEAKEYVKKCPQCQRFFKHTQHGPPNSTESYPFIQWGHDVVSALSRALHQFRFLLVVMDYFTKCVKAVVLSDVIGQQIVKFLWQNFMCHFGLPYTIISEDKTNFASKQVASF